MPASWHSGMRIAALKHREGDKYSWELLSLIRWNKQLSSRSTLTESARRGKLLIAFLNNGV